MACDKGPQKIGFAGQMSAGISKWAAKYAFLAGRNRTLSPTSLRRVSELAVTTRYALLGGLVGAGALVLAYRGIKQRRYAGLQRGIPAPRQIHTFKTEAILQPDHLFFYRPEDGFDQRAGEALTNEFGGAQLKIEELGDIIGSEGQIKPMLKMGGEDDIFLFDGPQGHIYFSMPDEGVAQVALVVPKVEYIQEVREVLNQALPKFVITDLVTGDEYETHDPQQARYFTAALGRDSEARIVSWEDKEEWSKTRKPIPEALFH
jgi:hypothetical protein